MQQTNLKNFKKIIKIYAILQTDFCSSFIKNTLEQSHKSSKLTTFFHSIQKKVMKFLIFLTVKHSEQKRGLFSWAQEKKTAHPCSVRDSNHFITLVVGPLFSHTHRLSSFEPGKRVTVWTGAFLPEGMSVFFYPES